MKNYQKALEIEDDMREFGCWTNGISDKMSDLFSYMTVLSFNKIDEFINLNTHNIDEWKDFIEHIDNHSYLSPIARLLSIHLKRKLNLNK